VENDINGWVCSDVMEMADRISSGAICSSCCRDFVSEHFSVANMTERYLDVYRCAMSTATAGHVEIEA
jgi:hypothetical protein